MPDDAPRSADRVPEQHGPSHPLCRHHQPWSRQAMTRAPEVPPTSVRALDAVEAEARLEELSDILEIGRASCRESVSVRVDLGGRRIINTNTHHKSDYLQVRTI